MRLTRFAQSCVLVETQNKRILIDPGFLQYKKSYLTKEWHNIDIILVTHWHVDHCHFEAIKEILKNPKSKFYTTQEVLNHYPELAANILKEGDILSLENIKIEVVHAAHGYTPYLKGGKEVYENVGYIIDDGKKRAYQTSDTICFENNYKCDILFIPVNNHGLVMGPYEAALFAKETGARLIIPIHYDNPKFPVDLQEVEKIFMEHELNFRFIKIGETIEI